MLQHSLAPAQPRTTDTAKLQTIQFKLKCQMSKPGVEVARLDVTQLELDTSTKISLSRCRYSFTYTCSLNFEMAILWFSLSLLGPKM